MWFVQWGKGLCRLHAGQERAVAVKEWPGAAQPGAHLGISLRCPCAPTACLQAWQGWVSTGGAEWLQAGSCSGLSATPVGDAGYGPMFHVDPRAASAWLSLLGAKREQAGLTQKWILLEACFYFYRSLLSCCGATAAV